MARVTPAQLTRSAVRRGRTAHRVADLLRDGYLLCQVRAGEANLDRVVWRYPMRHIVIPTHPAGHTVGPPAGPHGWSHQPRCDTRTDECAGPTADVPIADGGHIHPCVCRIHPCVCRIGAYVTVGVGLICGSLTRHPRLSRDDPPGRTWKPGCDQKTCSAGHRRMLQIRRTLVARHVVAVVGLL